MENSKRAQRSLFTNKFIIFRRKKKRTRVLRSVPPSANRSRNRKNLTRPPGEFLIVFHSLRAVVSWLLLWKGKQNRNKVQPDVGSWLGILEIDPSFGSSNNISRSSSVCWRRRFFFSSIEKHERCGSFVTVRTHVFGEDFKSKLERPVESGYGQ